MVFFLSLSIWIALSRGSGAKVINCIHILMYEAILITRACVCVYMNETHLAACAQRTVNISLFHSHLKLLQAWSKRRHREFFFLRRNVIASPFWMLRCLKCELHSVRYSHCKMIIISSSKCSEFKPWAINFY